jgi:hypothetical protein
MNSWRLFIGLAAACVSLSLAAQDTNDLKTVIGQFESRTDVLLVKGFATVGTIPLNQVELRVRSRETQDLATGEKVYGVSVEWGREEAQHRRILVDEDELNALVNAVNYLTAVNYDVTRQPGFEASFTTKAGLQVLAHSERKEGAVLTYLQFEDNARIPLTSVQIQQFGKLLEQARKELEVLKAGK